MKHQTRKALAAVMLPLLLLACSKEEPKDNQAAKTGVDLQKSSKNSKDLGYAIGLDIGRSLMNLKKDIDLDSTLQGIQDQFYGRSTALSAGAALKIKHDYAQRQRETMEAALKKLADKNKKEGDAFLAKNKKKEGVMTTASGLQYIVEKEGSGKTPTAYDIVSINYRGTLIDGTEFDSSYKRGKPSSVPVSGIIPGWREALLLMKVGSRYRVFIPPSLAYGDRGAGTHIGPNTTLIFDIEMLGIEKQLKN